VPSNLPRVQSSCACGVSLGDCIYFVPPKIARAPISILLIRMDRIYLYNSVFTSWYRQLVLVSLLFCWVGWVGVCVRVCAKAVNKTLRINSKITRRFETYPKKRN